jgi:hypothetical protein
VLDEKRHGMPWRCLLQQHSGARIPPQNHARHFICTEPDTLTVTVDVPPSSDIGAIPLASALIARALIIIMGRGITPL